jgi:hypothetical protein
MLELALPMAAIGMFAVVAGLLAVVISTWKIARGANRPFWIKSLLAAVVVAAAGACAIFVANDVISSI